eukprot:5228480-Pyramimonas_sp.AAC.1
MRPLVAGRPAVYNCITCLARLARQRRWLGAPRPRPVSGRAARRSCSCLRVPVTLKHVTQLASGVHIAGPRRRQRRRLYWNRLRWSRLRLWRCLLSWSNLRFSLFHDPVQLSFKVMIAVYAQIMVRLARYRMHVDVFISCHRSS